MQILKVHIQNINSLRGSVRIDFDEPPLAHAGIFAITGPTGAGKSTILDSITLALYGKIARNKQVKEVISYGGLSCVAEVEFIVDDQRYLASWRMHRARNKVTGKLVGPNRELAQWDEEAQVFRPIAEKIKDVDQAVERITRLDYQRFTRSVLLSQGDFAAFLRASDGERSELLERITGTAIYGELSKAAFQRHKLEQQQLTRLQERLEQVGVFNEEPIEEEQLTEARTQAQSLAKQAAEYQTQVQGVQRWKEAKEKIARLQGEIEHVNEQLAAFAPQRERLERHQALQPQAEELLGFLQREQEVTQLTSDLSQLLEQEVTLQTRAEQEEQQLRQAQTTLAEKQAQAAERETQFREVEQLDQQLRTEQEQWQKLQVRQQETQNRLTTVASELEQLQLTTQQQQTLLATATQWLADHEHLQNLPQQLPRLEEQRHQLNQLFLQQKEKRATLQNLEQKSATVAAAIATTTQELTHCQQEQATLEAAFRKQLPEDFTVDERAALHKLNQAITDLQNRRQVIVQLNTLDQAYQQLLTEQRNFEDQLGQLLAQQEHNNKELLTIDDQRRDFQEELQYKREVYRQQQLIANYEKDRQNLQAGDPCPLCLSTEHPFHEHPVTPYVDRAKDELDKAEAYDQRLQSTERQLMQRERDLHKEIALLRGDDLEPLQGRLNAHRERLLQYEQQISELLLTPMQTNDEWQTDRGQVLSQRLQALDQQLTTWQTAQQQLATIESALSTNTESLQQLQQTVLQQEGEQKQLQARQEQVAEELTSLDQTFAAAKEKINALLQPLGQQFDTDTFKAVFANLKTTAEQLLAQREQQQQAQQELALLQEQQQAKSLNQQEQKRVLDQLQEELQQQQTRIATARNKRQALLGDQEVATARQAQNEQLAAAQQEVKRLEVIQVNHKEERSALLQAIKDRRARREQLQGAQTTASALLLKTLSPLGYTTISGASQHLLAATEVSALSTTAQRLTVAQGEAQRARKEAQEEEQKFRPADTSAEALQQLTEEWQSARTAHEHQLQLLGQLEARYEQQVARQQQHQQLLQEIEQQRQEFNRWAALNEVIGQADGKKFRAFAQGLTLQRLVALANRHLEQLNGRYLIAKTPATDLSLDIIDTFQADNRRSMYTLSGGESFLISLALALGLSDLASRHAQIQSLFIDEGFGTLDEHSLDLALDTLENLQGSGKTIGIISHVKALKERIGVQIQVQKRSDGFSHVQVIA